MVLKSDQDRIRNLLSETIVMLCKSGLDFQSEFNVEALIGITIDTDDVFLVSIRETVRLSESSTEPHAEHSLALESVVGHLSVPGQTGAVSRKCYTNSHGTSDFSLAMSVKADLTNQMKAVRKRKKKVTVNNEALCAQIKAEFHTGRDGNSEVFCAGDSIYSTDRSAQQEMETYVLNRPKEHGNKTSWTCESGIARLHNDEVDGRSGYEADAGNGPKRGVLLKSDTNGCQYYYAGENSGAQHFDGRNDNEFAFSHTTGHHIQEREKQSRRGSNFSVETDLQDFALLPYYQHRQHQARI